MTIYEAIDDYEKLNGKQVGEYDEPYGTIRVVFDDLLDEAEFVPRNHGDLADVWYLFVKDFKCDINGIDYIYEATEEPYESKWVKRKYWRCVG